MTARYPHPMTRRPRRNLAPVAADLALAALIVAFVVFLVGVIFGWWVVEVPG